MCARVRAHFVRICASRARARATHVRIDTCARATCTRAHPSYLPMPSPTSTILVQRTADNRTCPEIGRGGQEAGGRGGGRRRRRAQTTALVQRAEGSGAERGAAFLIKMPCPERKQPHWLGQLLRVARACGIHTRAHRYMCARKQRMCAHACRTCTRAQCTNALKLRTGARTSGHRARSSKRLPRVGQEPSSTPEECL